MEAWLTRLDTSIERAGISGDKQSVECGRWLDQASDRRTGAAAGLAEASPFVPLPLWVALILGAALVVGHTCLYPDPGERIWVQAVMVGSITMSSLLSVRFLDMPYENRSGSINRRR